MVGSPEGKNIPPKPKMEWQKAKKMDWAGGWDGSPTLAAAPRWTTPKSGIGDKLEDKYSDKRNPLWKSGGWSCPGHGAPFPMRREKTGFRDTYMDHHQRVYSWVPGPGHFKTSRDFEVQDCAVERDMREKKGMPALKDPRENPDEIDSKLTIHNRHPTHTFARSERDCSKHHVKHIRRMLCPSHMFSVERTNENPKMITPGPGHYTQWSTFGQSSGPTRRRFFASHPSHTVSMPRSTEKFIRSSKRAFDGSGTMGSSRRSFSSPK